MQKFLYGFQFVWVIALISLNIGNTGAIALAASFFLLSLLPIFAIAYHQITSLLHTTVSALSTVSSPIQQEGHKGKIETIYAAIEKTGKRVIVILLVSVFVTLIYGVLTFTNGGWKFYSPEDSVSPLMISFELSALLILLFQLTVFQYLYSSFVQFQPTLSELYPTVASELAVMNCNKINDPKQIGASKDIAKPLSPDEMQKWNNFFQSQSMPSY